MIQGRKEGLKEVGSAEKCKDLCFTERAPSEEIHIPKATSQLWQDKQRVGTKSEAQIFSLLTALLTWEQGH